jgi:hypothetical protein
VLLLSSAPITVPNTARTLTERSDIAKSWRFCPKVGHGRLAHEPRQVLGLGVIPVLEDVGLDRLAPARSSPRLAPAARPRASRSARPRTRALDDLRVDLDLAPGPVLPAALARFADRHRDWWAGRSRRAIALERAAGHRPIGAVVQDDHGISAILDRRDLGEIDRAELDARVIDGDPGGGPQERDRQLAVAAKQLDEDLVVELKAAE